jgi:hypothetical protein
VAERGGGAAESGWIGWQALNPSSDSNITTANHWNKGNLDILCSFQSWNGTGMMN